MLQRLGPGRQTDVPISQPLDPISDQPASAQPQDATDALCHLIASILSHGARTHAESNGPLRSDDRDVNDGAATL